MAHTENAPGKGKEMLLIVAAILFPVISGICACTVPCSGEKSRKWLYSAVILLTDILGILVIYRGGDASLFTLADRVHMHFSVDALSRVFLTAVMLLYTAVTIYSFGYMDGDRRSREFFVFVFVSFGALIAASLAANLVTLYFFFELATLSTVPLVLYDRTKPAVSAGLKYLFYSMAGALMGLLCVFFLYYFSGGTGEFVPGGFLDPARTAGHETILLTAAFVGIIGFGTKAGLYPMHGWLPTAHPVAPAPASSLLSGIIAKAGVLAVIRLVYYSVGADVLRGTWVQTAWLSLAMLTVFMGSMMAFREQVLKKRLAYSTVSQISYIMTGLALLTPAGLKGGLLHLFAHMASKGCLFLAAGVFVKKLGAHHVYELKGVGKKMPATLACFLAASLSLVGIPPMAGFLSKWQLAEASLSSGIGNLSVLPPVILVISALLTAGYLFPVVIDGFFPGKDAKKIPGAGDPGLVMVLPMAALCLTALFFGIFGLQAMAAFGL